MTTLKLTEASIRAGASDESFERGQQLQRAGAISNAAIQGQTLSGDCAGTYAPRYQVRVELDKGGIRSATCTCPYDYGGYCKHIVALSLAYLRNPKPFAARRGPDELLADLTREQLLALVARLLRERPDLQDWVEAALAAPALAGAGKKPAAKRKPVDTSVYRRRVRGIMHSLDHMRMSEAYGHMGSLVGELQGVQDTAVEFLKAGEAETALAVLRALVEECHDGFEHLDDSDGELGDFLSGLGDTLAEAILSLDLSEDEREDLVSDLQEWHDHLSDYGVEGLDVAITAATYGWGDAPQDAPAPPPPSHIAAARDDQEDWEEDDEDDWEDDEEGDWIDDEDEGAWYASSWSRYDPVHRLMQAKLNVLERQGRDDEYLALCLKAGAHLRYALKLCDLSRVPEAVAHALGHPISSGEALTLAQRLREMDHLDEAIKVGERGLQLDGRKAELGAWLGAIEEARGRTAPAREAWLAAFRDTPSLAIYQTLKRLAGKGWSRLKPEVMKALGKFYDKQPLAEVLLFEQDWDAAAHLAEQPATYYRVAEMVADALIPHRPEWVIRTSLRRAEALIVETKSNLYPAAAAWLRRAKAAYAQLGQTAQWQTYLQNLKEQYKRRPALQAQLRQL